MSSSALRGQSSGDFKETSGRVQLFHVVTRNSMGALAADAFTQTNPPVYAGSTVKSTTLAGITKVGVLGGSIAFTRPQAGNNLHGGPSVTAGPTFLAGIRPLGIYLNDALGNAFENTPGLASGKGTYVHGSGTCVGVSLYETQKLEGAGAAAALTYATGDLLYASANGLLTNWLPDAYETLGSVTPVTVMGIVLAVPDATNALLVLDMRV